MKYGNRGNFSEQYGFGFNEVEPLYSATRRALSTSERFLINTLIKHSKMRRQKQVTYFTARRWRTNEKNRQIIATRVSKREPSREFIDLVGSELSNLVAEVIGTKNFDCVVPLPSGSSKSGGFATQIAQSIAMQTGLEFVSAFGRIQTSDNSSHPRKNLTRSRMRLEKIPGPRVLLVDDVATSGTHMLEAATMLRAHTQSTFCVAWIGR
ncbi:MAG: phosphoribosyltransferase [Pseudomonadota bacterium]